MPARQTITAIPIRKSLFGYGTEVSTPTSGGRTGHGNRSSGTGGSPPFLRRRRRAASRSASAARVAKNSAVFIADTFSATAVVTN